MGYSKEFKIGFFVVTVLVASFFLINYLRGEDIFNREIEVSSRYSEVDGLVASAPVYIKGYKAGKVSEVIYDSETDDFEVICSIMKEFRIPEDSRMTIYGVDIMGGKGIRIDLGKSSIYIEDGGKLQPYSEPALIDGLASGVGPIMEKLGNTLDSLNVTVTAVNSLLSENNRAGISRTLAHLERTMASVGNIADTVEGKSKELEQFMESLSSLSARFVTIAEKADTVMTDVASISSGLSESDIKGVVTSFKALLDNMNDPDGTIGKLFVDNSVYDSVDELLKDIDSLIRQIEENPKKYIRISIF